MEPKKIKQINSRVQVANLDTALAKNIYKYMYGSLFSSSLLKPNEKTLAAMVLLSLAIPSLLMHYQGNEFIFRL